MMKLALLRVLRWIECLYANPYKWQRWELAYARELAKRLSKAIKWE